MDVDFDPFQPREGGDDGREGRMKDIISGFGNGMGSRYLELTTLISPSIVIDSSYNMMHLFFSGPHAVRLIE